MIIHYHDQFDGGGRQSQLLIFMLVIYLSTCFFFHNEQDTLDIESAGLDENEEKLESDVKDKIPQGAEATNVLVGTLDELQDPVMAFVRLAKGVHLGEMSEVSIPVRFLFIMLGPSSHGEIYHQIGRSVATLMSDQVRVSVD